MNTKKVVKVLIISGIKWDSIWSHAHEVSRILSNEYYVLFLDPPKIMRGVQPHLKVLSKRNRGRIKVIDGGCVEKLGISFFIHFEVNAVKVLLKENPDVVVFYSVLPGFFAFLLAKFLKKKTVFMYVDDHRELLSNRIARIIASWTVPAFVKYSDGVISTARILYEESKKNSKAFYVTNGICLRDFVFPRRIPHRIVNVYFIGTLGKWVRIEDLVLLADIGFNVFVIGNGEKFNELKKMAKGRKNIRIRGYMGRNEALTEISKNCDLGVIPFLKNKLTDAVSPIKLFEFLALDKPVLASDTAELKSFDGCILLYSNENELRDKILYLKASPKLIKEIIKKNKKILKKYDWGSHLGKKILWAFKVIVGEVS